MRFPIYYEFRYPVRYMKDLVRQHCRLQTPAALQDVAAWVTEEAVAIQQIPAPTFAEQPRAAYVAEQFRALGLQDVRQDALYNVYGLLPGANPSLPGIMIMAHTDTVFSAQTDLTVRRENGTIHGAGLGDNSIGVAGMLGLAYALREQAIVPACDLWFVATSREEGLGDLDGARMAYDTLRDKIQAVVNVEGLAYGYVYRAGIAVRRLHIVARAEGGHSWLHFGRESAIHKIVQLGAAITAIETPETPRTTYNIGMVEGGQSINSIATDAGIWLDLRSEDTVALTELENAVRALVAQIQQDDVQIEVEVVGDRPAGQISAQHPLVRGAVAALAENGVRATLQVGSTDGNIPLAAGCPTVTVGITRGGNAHRLDEFIEVGPVANGMRQLIGLVLAAAAYQGAAEQ